MYVVMLQVCLIYSLILLLFLFIILSFLRDVLATSWLPKLLSLPPMAITAAVWDPSKKLTGSVTVVFMTPGLRSRAKGCLIGFAKSLLAGGVPRAPSDSLGVYDVIPDSLRHAHAAELVALKEGKSKGELSNYRCVGANFSCCFSACMAVLRVLPFS